jgi:predicted CXXCH cytochrome family protein
MRDLGACRLSEIKNPSPPRLFSSPSGVIVALILLLAPGPVPALDGSAPLPWGTKSVSSHAPYASRDCLGCHTKKWGGPLIEDGDNMCLACHEDAKQHVHAPKNCVRCHNAHDALRKKLLRADLEKCGECHQKK